MPDDHEFVISILQQDRAEDRPQRIAPAGFQTSRLITPIGPTSIGAAAVDGPLGRNCPAFAPGCPKIPFFCPGVDTQRGLFSPLGGRHGEIIKMKIKASGRLALMVATGLTGLLVCLAAPLPAHAAGSDASASKSDSATTDKSAEQSSRHGRRSARHRSSRTADKTADKSDSKKATNNDAGRVTSAGIPATVANANAELTSGDDNAAATPVKANVLIAAADKPTDQSDGNVVASDQLNEVDRALQQEQPAEQPQPAQPQTAQQEASPAPPPTVAVAAPKPAPVLASSDSASWDQTSLIGKIFIGFGALLTVASAARMFMA
ncbi:hypothetical protein [Bradyrhizobium sp. BRP56]|uniref:hypothetical protein n=1 Tax=Bradyrhizobium sp. BRP56 TaxID=2793819 RepID=UPI001CD6F5EC|nr:hypothetical protein [Bradyrhizobium sp. BRP56]